jgi:hypothetical protein
LTPLPVSGAVPGQITPWTGYWQTNEGVLEIDGLMPSHEAQYPYVEPVLTTGWTDPSNPSGWNPKAPILIMYSDAFNDNPLTNVLRGWLPPATGPQPNNNFSITMSAANPDAFSGQITINGVTTAWTGTYAGIAMDNFTGAVVQDPAITRPAPIIVNSPGNPPPHHRLAPPVLNPVGEMVADTQPTFTWSPVDGATSYDILLKDVTPRRVPGREIVVLNQEGLTGTSFTIPDSFRLSPEHTYKVEVRASDGAKTSAPSDPLKFTVAEQLTNAFRIRVDYSLEADVGIGISHFKFTIQAVEDSLGRPDYGPPRILRFTGPGVGIVDLHIPYGLGAAAKTSWTDLTTPAPMYLSGFKRLGSLIVKPSYGVGTLAGSDTDLTVGFLFTPAGSFSRPVVVSGASVGVTVVTAYAGLWTVGGYDKSLWPNTNE